ncbi:MerR family transcriptional regulator [Kineococcus sp. SYSU DK002]|uniref:hypothetical protein n=1 Tax=Kineococcus sp. SYSU DK002 TaxID=3383123 RepID=UPI003D7C91ED
MTDDRDDALRSLTEQVARLTEQVSALVEHLRPTDETAVSAHSASRTWSLAEAADRLGVTSSQLRTDVRQRRVPYLRVGKSYRFTDEQLREITQVWTVPVVPDAPNPWGRKRRPQHEEARRWAHHHGEPMPPYVPPKQTHRKERPTPRPSPQDARLPPEPTVRIACPGVGAVVPLMRSSTINVPLVSCPGCALDSLLAKQPAGTLPGTGMVGRHAKHVPADGPEAHLPLYARERGAPPVEGGNARRSRAPAEPQVRGQAKAGKVTIRCPGSGKSIQLDKPTPPRCPSCKRDDLQVPRFTPSKSFGLVPAHGKVVPADSKEAALPRWG